ncbi:PQ-loop domain-containing transporter [Gracilimonas tropica]|uniref:PQ-loop domain-containing transporter n=1 Tax=Gracilimonas tropica TaxID=454600 RepID=UPI00036D143A|nr:PQ-loop domain-containing transporter [Gracilimonas tropica]
MTGIEFLGWAGFGILVAAWIPQTLDTLKAGKTEMNIAFIIMYFSSSLLLTIYSVITEDPVFTALNALLTIGSGINMYYKLFPRKRL